MLLSVILPVHNTAAYLPECVESIVNQCLNPDDFEIILVENASTDDSLDVCKELKERYSQNHIILIHTDTAGVGNARNLGMEASQGEYIHFIDSDDWIEGGMYSSLLSENKSNADLLITGLINDYEYRRIKKEAPSKLISCTNHAQISDFLLQVDNRQKVWCMNVIWNKWYKADVIRINNLKFRTDINLGEDFVFNCSFIEKIGTLKILPVAFYHYMHRGNVTLVNKFRIDVLYRRPIIYHEYCSLFEHYGILRYRKPDIDWLEGKLLFGSLYTVFNVDCNLRYSEKLAFIKEICESSYFALGFLYLKSSHSMYHKILLFLIEHKIYRLVYGMLFLRVKRREKFFK